MFKKLLNIPAYLNLKEVGVLELTFALTPMLSGFSLGSIPLSALMWVILIMITVSRKGVGKIRNFKPLTIFVVYWLLHTLAIMAVDQYNLNGLIVQVIYFAAVYLLYPILNPQKLRGSMNWVALIAIGGLLYQWTIVAVGGGVHPLEIPGLEMSVNRLDTLTIRPSSFFMEPQAYVSFMICPLALALMNKKYVWSLIIILSIFLTTSTTGIILSFIILVASLFSHKVKARTIGLVSMFGVMMAYSLVTFDAFSAGVEKIENTEASTNVRLSQGPRVVSSMKSEEFFLGVPYSSAYNYCRSGRFSDVIWYGESVYMSTFWNIILLYGIVGLSLYLNIYYKLYIKNRLIWPILICTCATMFSDPDFTGLQYVYRLIFMLVLATRSYMLVNEKKLHVR